MGTPSTLATLIIVFGLPICVFIGLLIGGRLVWWWSSTRRQFYRSAAQDYCKEVGEAGNMMRNHLMGRHLLTYGKVEPWTKRINNMNARYSALLGQTPDPEAEKRAGRAPFTPGRS